MARRREWHTMVRTETRSYRLLVVLLLADCAFILIHLLHIYTDLLPRGMFSIEREAGCGEWFQYIKEGAVAMVLFVMAKRNSSGLYRVWAFLFFFLLLDDAGQLHERLGRLIARHGEIQPLLGMTRQDVGELCVSLGVGTIFMVLIGAFHRRARPVAKRISVCLLGMIVLLVLFGVAVDMVHSAALGNPMYPVLGMIEDGGEMLVMSVITWFVFRDKWSMDALPGTAANRPST